MGINYEDRPRAVTASIAASATCNRCEEVLSKVHESETSFPQFSNALLIELDGSYGMFFDSTDDIDSSCPLDEQLILCHDCAHAFLDFMNIKADGLHGHSTSKHRRSNGIQENASMHTVWDSGL